MTGSPSPAPPMSILIVEDESAIAFLLQKLLTHFGHEVVGPANSVTDALELARRRRLDAAVLDVQVGGVDVYPVAEKLDDLGVPYIFTTGAGGDGVSALFRDRPVLKKPFLARDLSAKLAKLAGRNAV